MATKRAFGLGPLETIVNVGWGSPMYVSIYCSADVRGSPESPPHLATVALSAKAIERGCKVVLDTGGIVPDPYFTYAKLVVLKVPAVIPDTLCTLTLSGTTQTTELPPPDYACGTWTTTITIVRGEDLFPDAIDPLATFTETLVDVTPDGTTTTVTNPIYHYRKDDPASVAYVESIAGTSEESHEALYYHDEFGRLVDTGLPCGGVPTTLVELYTYDNVQVIVNPVKDHVVSDPGGPFFLFDPSAAVKVPGSGLFGGSKTSIWRCDLSYRVSNGALDGLNDGSYPFKIQKDIFAKSRIEKIIEVYPSAFKAGFGPLTYRGGFRLNKKPPTGNMYFTNWDGTAPDFINGIVLYGGSAPPPVPYTPDSIPF